jgi:CDP-6-deoxy-D-xylo-4-hexulose-3-dehydrase
VAGTFFYIEWPHSGVEASGKQKFKARPALAISGPDVQGDVTLLKVTTRAGYGNAVVVRQADMASGVLRSDSCIRIDRFLTVNKSALVEWGARLGDKKLAEVFKALALSNTRAFSALAHSANLPADTAEKSALPFDPETSPVPYAGRVFDHREVEAAVASTLDFWLTLGPQGEDFERELARFLGVRRSILVNSGSSANLLAVSALTSHKLPGERRLRPGDEVITTAAGFPTTVAPILQCGAVPVFLDADPLTLNARADQLDAALAPGKTKAVILAHTLGNPFDLAAVTAFCAKHNLWLIEDNCDALGAAYAMPGAAPKLTGTFGDLSTQSFYPPHHLTMGEGGAVGIVRDMKFKVLVESFRDWGRDCWCASGVDNTCGKRFSWQLGDLPGGYDHKYIYSHLGYNLKPLDIQAAIGRQQLARVPSFIEARRRNWQFLRAALVDLAEFFDFQLPTHATRWTPAGFEWDASGARCEPSWFGFMLMVKTGAPFSRADLARHLDEHRIGNRPLFGGNLVRQPVFTQLRSERPEAFRVIGDLRGADEIMNRAVFVGVYPGLTQPMLEHVVATIRKFARGK